MAGKNTAAFGIYPDQPSAADAVEALKKGGFRSTDISLLCMSPGFAGSLAGVGVSEFEAKRYEGRIQSGGVLLSVHCDTSDWTKRAKTVIALTGASDVASTDEAKADPLRKQSARQVYEPTAKTSRS
jgi:hypothetical protein